jgi:SAM-dependent methyltransferase
MDMRVDRPQLHSPTVPSFRVWSALWTDFPEQAQQLARGPGVTRVCELGGGANPIIPLELIAERGLEHEVADISAEELAKVPEGYRTVQVDATSRDFEARGPYDLIVTAFLAEHIPDPSAFHSVVRSALRPGGLAFHVFPTLYEPAFLANLLLSERVAEPLLRRIQPGREPEGAHGKFPAHYRWCRGPTRRQIRRFEHGGYDVLDYVGYFGHGYFTRVSPLDRAEQALAHALARRPVPAITSYATVVLRRRDRPREAARAT